MKSIIELNVNGLDYQLAVEPNRVLLDILRQDLGLTGTKCGCRIGDCGACTVLMNDIATFSCLVLGVQASGSSILTVEGLAEVLSVDVSYASGTGYISISVMSTYGLQYRSIYEVDQFEL